MKHLLRTYHLIPLLMLICFQVISATSKATDLQKETIYIGYIRSQIYGVNRQDAEAAFKTLSRTLGVQHGYDVEVEVHSFADAHELEKYISHAPLNIVILDSWNYLELRHLDELEPIFVHFQGDRVLQRYLLLAGNNIQSISELHHKRINVFSGNTGVISQLWLKSQLEQFGVTSAEHFFQQLNYQNQPMATVLPVFFGKIDAAVIEEAKFELMQELNPQLKKLRPIAISEPLLLSMVCFGKTSWSKPEMRELMIRTLESMQKTPAGQQILTLFKTEKVVPFEPHLLDSIWRLKSKTSSFTASSPSGLQ